MNILFNFTKNIESEMSKAKALIQEIMENPNFGKDIWGFVDANYLSPSNDSPPIIDSGNRVATNESADLGTGAIVLAAIGSVAFIFFVTSVYYWRRTSPRERGENGSVMEGAATQAAGSTLFMIESGSPCEGRISPFSEMLPSAYRFNENMSILSGSQNDHLDIVLERSEESSIGERSELLVSDCGYTTEGEDSMIIDASNTLYAKNRSSGLAEGSPLILGACRRPHSPDSPLLGVGLDESDVVDDDVFENMV
jgi:hypothetical protein